MPVLKRYDGSNWITTIVGKQGPTGATGATGAAGAGVATGGTTGQVLVKSSNTNYDTSWTSSPTTITVAQSQVTNLGTDLAAKAPLASPTFTGTPAAPTAAADTNTTQIATTAYVIGQGYLKSSTATSTYAPLASPALTGTPTAPTATTGTNTTQVATTAFVVAQIAATTADPFIGPFLLGGM